MKKKRIGVVADDITGSNDIGVMLAKNGFSVTVISLKDDPVPADFSGADALVINTGSRLDAAAVAADKSARAAAFLRENGCELVYSKTCSVFRGNIGASFDAIQDTLGVSTSMVVAGFPRNGRTTVDGVHYLNGVPVNQTSFAHDPVTPIAFARLDELIGRQSTRPCAGFTAAWLDKPLDVQRAHLAELSRDAAYVIFDVRDQEDLKRIATLVADAPNICGSSAICEELPGAWGMQSPVQRCPVAVEDGSGVMILAGSLTPQTAAQVALLEAEGVARLVLNPALLLTEEERAEEVRHAVAFASERLPKGEDVLVYASRDTEGVHARSAALGLNDIGAGRRISLAFEDVARAVYAQTGIPRYVVAGGETSDAVSRGLGVRTMRIWQEIEAGVPVMTAKTHHGSELLLVLKSGSFGSPAFLRKAVNALRGA